MREFKTASLADQVFAKLEGDIIQGIYPKGEILTELKLVEQLGVSRTPIREALRRLTEAGGTPAGHELSNIRFIGTKKNGPCGYEGYGGWTWVIS